MYVKLSLRVIYREAKMSNDYSTEISKEAKAARHKMIRNSVFVPGIAA